MGPSPTILDVQKETKFFPTKNHNFVSQFTMFCHSFPYKAWALQDKANKKSTKMKINLICIHVPIQKNEFKSYKLESKKKMEKPPMISVCLCQSLSRNHFRNDFKFIHAHKHHDCLHLHKWVYS